MSSQTQIRFVCPITHIAYNTFPKVVHRKNVATPPLFVGGHGIFLGGAKHKFAGTAAPPGPPVAIYCLQYRHW